MSEHDETMKPGRKLDALVAEKVMGWERWTYGDPETGPTILREPSGWPGGSIRRGTGPLAAHAYAYITPYSTYLLAAWKVVEKRHGLGDPSTITYGTHDGRTLAYLVNFRMSNAWAVAETLEHAICLAALRAVSGGNHA